MMNINLLHGPGPATLLPHRCSSSPWDTRTPAAVAAPGSGTGAPRCTGRWGRGIHGPWGSCHGAWSMGFLLRSLITFVDKRRAGALALRKLRLLLVTSWWCKIESFTPRNQPSWLVLTSWQSLANIQIVASNLIRKAEHGCSIASMPLTENACRVDRGLSAVPDPCVWLCTCHPSEYHLPPQKSVQTFDWIQTCKPLISSWDFPTTPLIFQFFKVSYGPRSKPSMESMVVFVILWESTRIHLIYKTLKNRSQGDFPQPRNEVALSPSFHHSTQELSF